MFVEHRGMTPVETLTGAHHGPGEIHDLIIGQAISHATREEGAELYVAVAPPGDVAHDGIKLSGAEHMAEELGAHMPE